MTISIVLALRHSGVRRNPVEFKLAAWIPAFAGMTVGAGIQYSLFMVRQPCVYLLASRRNGTLYVGVTSDPVKRIWEHKNDVVEGFTKRYRVHTLVWFELHETMESAIAREKAIKEWKRKWKLDLIEKSNPAWADIYPTIV